MPKERNYNPVQAQHKADKAKAIKKGKSEQQARRNEKLAKQNPNRIQKQIDDLKALKESGGKLTNHEEQALEALEKDLKAVKKAREALGDKAPTFSHHDGPRSRDNNGGGGVLGKRRRDDDASGSDDSDAPEDVKSIPMPRDTPPPIPKEVLDEWYAKRRARRAAHASANENTNPSAARQRSEAPVVEAKIVYEAQPVVRDLKKEAVSAFMPTAVRMKIEKVKGQSGLLEPEEADQLEREGYLKTGGGEEMEVDQQEAPPRRVMVEDAEDDED
ncbi:WW domain binding protein 11-domain-containing protein [Lasiosphaeris hirsuta]|uniref:WW domain binding protein 11-domain-containing protein n=1 Tax=Lasiosphaeris hirsuta TaxID=260670 RepID=A0AA40B8Y1_9PEZI|nr:WW domain binding protein 11-domain-containing protein [Lasiosphaeris hirsuta]